MKKKQLTMWATGEEIASIQAVKEFYSRTTISDTLRFLIMKEAKKFYPKIYPMDIIHPRK